MDFIFRYIVEVILVNGRHLPCIKGFTNISDAVEFINAQNEGKQRHYDAKEENVNSNLNKDVILYYKLYDKETKAHYASILLRDLKQLI